MECFGVILAIWGISAVEEDYVALNDALLGTARDVDLQLSCLQLKGRITPNTTKL